MLRHILFVNFKRETWEYLARDKELKSTVKEGMSFFFIRV